MDYSPLCSKLLRVSVAARVVALLAYRAEDACICLSPSIFLFFFYSLHGDRVGHPSPGSCCKCGIDVADRPSLRKSMVHAALRPDLFWGSLLALSPPREVGTEYNR